LLGIVIIGGGIALLSANARASSFDLKGTLTLQGKTMHDGQGWCGGGGGYSDIAEGALVTVYDAGGKVVATGSLGRGDDHHWSPNDSEHANMCWFTFSVSVPSVDFYQVEVNHRGKVTYSLEDSKGGRVALTLGDGS
jgi:hypothetical protein